jgi:flagellar hook-length control protein FliK
MTKVPPPAPPADPCAPVASKAVAAPASGTGFRDALADVVTRAAPDSTAGKTPEAAPATPVAAALASGTAEAAPASPDGTPAALSATLLDAAAPEILGGKAAAAPMREQAGAAPSKKAGPRKDKDDSADAGLGAGGQSPQPAAALAGLAAVPPIPAVPLPAPSSVGTQGGSAGDDTDTKGPSVGEVKGDARRPVAVSLDGAAPNAIGPVQAAKVALTRPVPDEPATKGPLAASATVSATGQNIPMAPPAHIGVVSSGPPASPSSSPASGQPAQPPNSSPATQVAPAMVSLVSGAAGTHHLVVRLDPPDLGHVEVRMVRGPDTDAHVEVVVERPATLALLRQDAPALHQALSDAGVPVQGRSLTMQLGQPGGQQLSGQGGGGQGGWSPRRFSAPDLSPRSGSARIDGVQFPTAMRALRSALDITA